MGVGILGGLSYNATGTAYAALRDHASFLAAVRQTPMDILGYQHKALSVAATMGINNVIRISAWICLVAAIIALFSLQSVSRMAARK